MKSSPNYKTNYDEIYIIIISYTNFNIYNLNYFLQYYVYYFIFFLLYKTDV